MSRTTELLAFWDGVKHGALSQETDLGDLESDHPSCGDGVKSDQGTKGVQLAAEGL